MNSEKRRLKSYLKKSISLLLVLGLTCAAMPALADTDQNGTAQAAAAAAEETQAAVTEETQEAAAEETQAAAAERETEQETPAVSETDENGVSLTEDPEYYKYYNADGTAKVNRNESLEEFAERLQTLEQAADSTLSGQTQTASGQAGLSVVKVTDKKIKSPFTGLVYTGKNGKVSHGIDVSKWQGDINWKKVKAAGVDYAIIRCGNRYLEQGSIAEDPMFYTYIKGAMAAGLKVGVYVYSQAINTKEAKAEADFCIRMLGSYLNKLELPIVMDVEYGDGNTGRLARANLSKQAQTNVIKAFAKEIIAKGGVPAYYVSASMTAYNLYPEQLKAAGCYLWVARVNTKLNDSMFTSSDYFMWQYAETSVPGISTGNTDVNFVYTDDLPVNEPEDEDCTFEEPASVSTTQTDTTGESSGGDSVTATAITDHRPTNVTSINTSTANIKLTWTAPSEGYGYVIRRSTNGKTWKRVAVIKNLSETSYTDSDAKAGTVYRYQISTRISEDGLSRSQYTESVYGVLKPTAVTVSQKMTGAAGITLKWTAGTNVTGYRIYKKTQDSEYQKLTDTDALTLKDTDTVYGSKYTYRVRAYVVLPSGKRVYGAFSAEFSAYRLIYAPKMASSDAVNDHTLHIVWNPAASAVAYRIYRKAAGGKYSYLATVKAEDETTLLEYTDTNVNVGVSYSYRVRSFYKADDGTKVLSGYSKAITDNTIPGLTKIKSLTPCGFLRLKLSWKAVNQADGYRVLRLNSDGTTTTVKDVDASTHSLVISGLTRGIRYHYTVRAFVKQNGKKIFGELDAVGKAALTAIPATDFSLVSKKSGKVRVSWNKVPGAGGYEILCKTSVHGKVSKLTVLKGSSVLAKTVAGKAGRYRYYTVRAYKKINGVKIYSKYEWKRIKVK